MCAYELAMANRRSRRISTLGSRLSSLASVALVLVLLGVAALCGVAGRNLNEEVRRNLGFTIKMERDCASRDIDLLKKSLLDSGVVELLTFSSAEDILKEESEYLGEDISATIDENPYSAELDVRVRSSYSSPDSIALLAERYKNARGVEEIITESSVIEGVDSTLRRVGLILVLLAAVLMFISVALIHNTISLSIYARRFVIHTMKLVGATGAFIRRPFIQSAAFGGCISGVVAAGFLALLRAYGSSLDPLFGEALPWSSVIAVGILLAITGGLICLITAVIATNRYLRASYDQMFLK